MPTSSTTEKKVFIVLETHDYEGSTVVAVFATPEAAYDRAAKLQKKAHSRSTHFEVEEFEVNP